MKDDGIDMLARLAELSYQAQAAKLQQLQQAQAALRQQMAALQASRRPALDVQPDQARIAEEISGTSLRWNAFIDTRLRDLARQLAENNAKQQPSLVMLRRAFGKKLAIAAVSSRNAHRQRQRSWEKL
jgi:metal-dependent amidase/aminoacylase/carboxypeptidase family protein